MNNSSGFILCTLYVNLKYSINKIRHNRDNYMKEVSVVGATGLVGRMLVDELIQDPAVGRIQIWSRRPLQIQHEKVEVVVADLMDIQHHDTDFCKDALYCCIGTTNAKTPDETTYKAIDYGIPVSAACKARRDGTECMAVISSIGANHQAQPFYLRIKGEMERDVQKHGPRRIIILRPSFLLGNRSETRMGESIGKVFIQLFGPLLFGLWKKYRGIQAKTVALAMKRLSFHNQNQIIWESDEIEAAGN